MELLFPFAGPRSGVPARLSSLEGASQKGLKEAVHMSLCLSESLKPKIKVRTCRHHLMSLSKCPWHFVHSESFKRRWEHLNTKIVNCLLHTGPWVCSWGIFLIND